MIQKNLLVSVCDVSPHWLSTITFLHPHFEKTRTKYSQIRKYEITFIFGVQIFYEYIFGKSFKIITDHKLQLGLLHEHKGIPSMGVSGI